MIYVDNDIVTADYSVLGVEESYPRGDNGDEHNDSDDHNDSDNHNDSDDHNDDSVDQEDNFESVIEHNDKLVNILQNSLEMQAYLFDKLLNFVF